MVRMLQIIGLILLTTGLRGETGEGKVRLTGSENYARNRPGVVMIRTEYTANVYVNNMRFDQRAFNKLLDSIQKLDNGGGVLAEQKLDIVLQELNNNPARYIQTTFDYIKQPEKITAVGSGFFITGDGYVATNCHMIDRDNAFIRRQFMLTAFQQITDANISALESSWATSFTDQQRSLLYTTYSSVYSRLFSMVLYDLKKNIYVVYRQDHDKQPAVSVERPATIVAKGQQMPGKDVAILKIETDQQMPVLPIANARLPEVGDQLFVYGYPGPVTNNDFVSVESAIEPTLTTGIVSGIKKSVNGWPVIQMDANINHGSSGGPVCNDAGEVVGITTFGSIGNSGELAAGLNFAVPVTILNEYIDSASVTPKLSKATVLYTDGLYYLDREYYGAALKRFEEVRKLNPAYPGVYDYIVSCRAGLGKARSTGPVENILLCVGLFIILFGFIVWFRARREAI